MPILDQLSRSFTAFCSRRPGSAGDADEESRFRNYTIFCSLGVPLMVAFVVYNLVVGAYLLAMLISSSAAFLLIGVHLIQRGIPSRRVYRSNSLVFCVLLLYMAAIGGADGSKLLWFFTFPLIVCFLLGSREGAWWTVLLFASSQAILWNPWQLGRFHHYPAEFASRFDLACLCVATFTYFYERFRYSYRTKIEEQYRLLDAEIGERRRIESALRQSLHFGHTLSDTAWNQHLYLPSKYRVAMEHDRKPRGFLRMRVLLDSS